MGPGSAREERLAGTALSENSHPVHRYRNLGTVLDGLVDHAIALGEFQQQIELVLRRVGVDIETQPNLRETDRRLLVDAERAAEIEIALGRYQTRLQRHLDRGRYRLQRHTGTGN